MEGSFYNLRQRPFPVSTIADSLTTIVTSSALTNTVSYPSTGRIEASSYNVESLPGDAGR